MSAATPTAVFTTVTPTCIPTENVTAPVIGAAPRSA